MQIDNRTNELKNKWLCYRCIGEDFLKRDIQAHGKTKKCSYCEKLGKSFSVEEISARIEKAFSVHYIRTPNQPTAYEYAMQDGRGFYRDGEEVVDAIMNAADMPIEAAADVQRILEDEFEDFEAATMGDESEFGRDTYYSEKGTDDSHWQLEWEKLEQSLKSQSRFFNQPAAQHLATIFDGLDSMKARDGRPMIIDAGPSTTLISLYRARVFQSDKILEEALIKSDQQIGPPKSADANAGRMNAKGISVFYGSNEPLVALAEVRPPVGSNVVIARFDLIRPVRLLDLTALENISIQGSVFDPEYNHRLEQAMFLGNLSRRITKPVMPDDEAFEYLSTQAISDFLASNSSINIDGIIYPSIQVNGKALNVVLFHKAAKVEKNELPEGTMVSASLGNMYEEGWEVDYQVTEQLPREKDEVEKIQESSNLFDFNIHDLNDWDDDNGSFRKATLNIDLHSIKVHAVESVEFTTSEHTVNRNRFIKHDTKF